MTTTVLALASLLGTAIAGRGPGYELQWSAPRGCPDKSAVTEEIDGLLVGGEVPTEVAVVAKAVVLRRGEQFHLELEVHREGTQGRRELSASTCEELVEAAGLIVAMTIDPTAARRAAQRPDDPAPQAEDTPPDDDAAQADPPPKADPSTAEPEPATAPRDVESEPEILEPQPEEDEPHSDPVLEPSDLGEADEDGLEIGVGGFARVGAGVGLGVLPGAGANVQATLGLRWPAWTLGLTGRYWAPRRGEAQGPSDAAGRFQLWSVGVEGGRVFGSARWEVPLWVGISGGAVHGRGEDLPVVVAKASLWMAAHGGVAVWWVPLDYLAVGPLVEASLGWTRPSFVTARGVLIHEAGIFAGHFGAAVEFRWGQP